MIEVPRPGKYKVIVTLKTENPLPKVSLCTDWENLSFPETIPAGISRQTMVINAGNHADDIQHRICQDRTISVTVTAATDCLHQISVSEISCPVIYIAGSAEEAAESMYGSRKYPSDPYTAMPAALAKKLPEACHDIHNTWKQMLNAYTGQEVAISDYSYPGLTTESFRKEGHLAAIYEYSKPGDFCFFQFDPIGQSLEDWMPKGACRRHLARFIIECRERFMYPVLLTPAFRHNNTNVDDYTGQLQRQCLAAYQEVGKLTSTPVIELHKLRVTVYDAYVAAGIVAKEIARVCSAYPERGYRFLVKCMDKPIGVNS